MPEGRQGLGRGWPGAGPFGMRPNSRASLGHHWWQVQLVLFLRTRCLLVFWLSPSSLNPPWVSGTCVSRIFLKSIRRVCRVTPQGWGTHHPETFALLRDSHPCQVTVTGWEGLLSHRMVLSCWDNVVSWLGLAGFFLALNYPGKFSLWGRKDLESRLLGLEGVCQWTWLAVESA